MHMALLLATLYSCSTFITLMLIALFYVCKHKGDESIVLPASLFNFKNFYASNYFSVSTFEY